MMVDKGAMTIVDPQRVGLGEDGAGQLLYSRFLPHYRLTFVDAAAAAVMMVKS